jgi:hypothetical protein
MEATQNVKEVVKQKLVLFYALEQQVLSRERGLKLAYNKPTRSTLPSIKDF